MTDIEIVVVPRDLYYHEVSYVRGLEAEIERLKAHVEAAEQALIKIASCEKHMDGDVVDIARKALEAKP